MPPDSTLNSQDLFSKKPYRQVEVKVDQNSGTNNSNMGTLWKKIDITSNTQPPNKIVGYLDLTQSNTGNIKWCLSSVSTPIERHLKIAIKPSDKPRLMTIRDFRDSDKETTLNIPAIPAFSNDNPNTTVLLEFSREDDAWKLKTKNNTDNNHQEKYKNACDLPLFKNIKANTRNIFDAARFNFAKLYGGDNLCYLNALFQFLTHTPLGKVVFSKNINNDEITDQNKKDFEAIKNAWLTALRKYRDASENNSVVNLDDLRQALQKCSIVKDNKNQQDAAEVLDLLLDIAAEKSCLIPCEINQNSLPHQPTNHSTVSDNLYFHIQRAEFDHNNQIKQVPDSIRPTTFDSNNKKYAVSSFVSYTGTKTESTTSGHYTYFIKSGDKYYEINGASDKEIGENQFLEGMKNVCLVHYTSTP
ncbi:MAG: hypothetical protein P8176_05240 [Gammaproteobacteria bacterium]